MASEVEITDTEIDELVAAVSEEVGLTSNDDDDVPLDLGEDIAVEELPKTSTELHNEFADKTLLPTFLNADCQDTSTVTLNPGSGDKQSQKNSVESTNETNSDSPNESLPEACAGSTVADLGPQMTRNIPGKALPVSSGSVNPELSAVDSKADDSMSAAQNASKMQLPESERDQGIHSFTDSDIHATDMKSKNSQRSKKSETKSPSSAKGWGWSSLGSWSSSVLSTATSITSQVGESFYHVLETVESSLVEPMGESARKKTDDQSVKSSWSSSTSTESYGNDPKLTQQEQMKSHRDEQAEDTAAAAAAANSNSQFEGMAKDARKQFGKVEHATWLPGWNLSSLTQLTGAVTNTGKKMVSSGLGVIGDIGKKTYNILLEDDEDSNTARKTNAKIEEMAGIDNAKVKKNLSQKETSVSSLQQDDAGVAHMEALEELSRWSSETLGKQLTGLKGKSADAIHDDMALINDSFHFGDFSDIMDASDKEHDFVRLVTDFVSQLGLQLNVNKLIKTQANARKWLVEQSLKVPEMQQLQPQEAYESAMRSFSDLTAAGVALYHKVAQLLLIENSGNPLLSYKFRALSLVGLTKVLCFEIYVQSSQFTHLLLSDKQQSEAAVKSLVEGIEVEASNSAKCLQDACSHLLPVMQLAVTKIHPLLSDHSGIPHLESLQVLSSMSQNNICEALSQFEREARRDVEAHLSDIEASFDLGYLQTDDETDQDHDAFSSHALQLVQKLTNDAEAAQKLVEVQQRIQKYLKDCERDESLGLVKILTNDVHQTGVQSLADWTAVCIQLYYGIAQSMLLDQPCDVLLYAQKAANLASLTKLLCIEVGCISTQFTCCLSAAASLSDSVTPFVTNIYLEASSSSTCIQDAFQLLLPVVQLALLKAEPVCRQLTTSSPAADQ